MLDCVRRRESGGRVGSALGALVAYHRGLLDQIAMRVIDVLLGFPTFLAALLVIAVLPSGYLSIFIVVVVVTSNLKLADAA